MHNILYIIFLCVFSQCCRRGLDIYCYYYTVYAKLIFVIVSLINNYMYLIYYLLKGSYIEVYSGIEFPKHDFQFNYDTNCRIYMVILHHSGLSYNMF